MCEMEFISLYFNVIILTVNWKGYRRFGNWKE